MLYTIGPILIDVAPFNADDVSREDSVDFAAHDLLGRRKTREFMGAGDDTINIKGSFLPFTPGKNGLSALEVARGAMAAGEPLYCLRGDGVVLGWRLITSISEGHTMIQGNGVGGVVTHEIKLVREDAPGPDAMAGAINSLLSLFG